MNDQGTLEQMELLMNESMVTMGATIGTSHDEG